MTTYASRVNLPGLTLEVVAFATDAYPAELVEDLPEVCSLALRRFVQIVEQNTQTHEREITRRQDRQAVLEALKQRPETPQTVDPWGTVPEEPPC